jgi:hypothetical protein
MMPAISAGLRFIASMAAGAQPSFLPSAARQTSCTGLLGHCVSPQVSPSSPVRSREHDDCFRRTGAIGAPAGEGQESTQAGRSAGPIQRLNPTQTGPSRQAGFWHSDLWRASWKGGILRFRPSDPRSLVKSPRCDGLLKLVDLSHSPMPPNREHTARFVFPDLGRQERFAQRGPRSTRPRYRVGVAVHNSDEVRAPARR